MRKENELGDGGVSETLRRLAEVDAKYSDESSDFWREFREEAEQ